MKVVPSFVKLVIIIFFEIHAPAQTGTSGVRLLIKQAR